MKRAIISVSNKAGIVEFAQGLKDLGIEIISTGGTAKVLQKAGIEVQQISEITKFPEMMDGRVKTLHPNIHGGILARRSNGNDLDQLQELGIEPIDLVVVNLYPFAETVARSGVDLDEILENIDIGGPTLIRAAAKNFRDVAVVVDQTDYPTILTQLEKTGDLNFQSRMNLAQKAFKHTADYDKLITQYFQQQLKDEDERFPEVLQLSLEKVTDLRYGENPHQAAAFYREIEKPKVNSLSTAKKLHGKELSFNNLNDAHGALELVREFSEPAAVVIKHTNPCGAALGDSLAEAFQKAYAGDPQSAYGSVVAVNRPVDRATAEIMVSGKKFIEIILAPSYEPQALELLKGRWKNIRIMEVGEITAYASVASVTPFWDIKQIQGGFLVQDLDQEVFASETEIVSQKAALSEQMNDLEFAWKVCKHVKSNAITLVRDGMVVGVGAGQMSRVDSMKIAIRKAGERTQGAVAASDAFIPFRDAVDEAAQVGITALIQPGGSIRDQEVITACDQLGLVMLFTKMRHFKH